MTMRPGPQFQVTCHRLPNLRSRLPTGPGANSAAAANELLPAVAPPHTEAVVNPGRAHLWLESNGTAPCEGSERGRRVRPFKPCVSHGLQLLHRCKSVFLSGLCKFAALKVRYLPRAKGPYFFLRSIAEILGTGSHGIETRTIQQTTQFTTAVRIACLPERPKLLPNGIAAP